MTMIASYHSGDVMSQIVTVLGKITVAACLATGAIACGSNVCEQAADVCGGSNENISADECTGGTKVLSECIVDADSCSTEALVSCLGA